MPPHTTESGRLKTTLPRLPFSQSSGWQLRFATWVQKWDRSVLPELLTFFLLVSKVMEMRVHSIYMVLERQLKHGGVKHIFPVSNHQLLGCVGVILARMTASWTGFLIPALVTEGFLISWPPIFPTFLTGRSSLQSSGSILLWFSWEPAPSTLPMIS